jgi:hypothetical protein
LGTDTTHYDYFNAAKEKLNEENPNAFHPALNLLDALIASSDILPRILGIENKSSCGRRSTGGSIYKRVKRPRWSNPEPVHLQTNPTHLRIIKSIQPDPTRYWIRGYTRDALVEIIVLNNHHFKGFPIK